jgi:hypothetical protein
MIIPAMKEKRPWIDKTWSRQKMGFIWHDIKKARYENNKLIK